MKQDWTVDRSFQDCYMQKLIMGLNG